MAVTEFGDNSPQTVQVWSKKLAREAISKTFIRQFMGTDINSIICYLKDLEVGRGGTIYFDLLRQMTGAGVDGDTRLKGFEEALTFFQDSLKIDQKRNAHAFRTMSQQRTVHDLRNSAKMNLADWFAVKFDTYMFAYLCGITGDGPHAATELPFAANALEVPDAAHAYNVGGPMTLDVIDHLVEAAKVLNPKIRPVKVNGRSKYCLVLHPFQTTAIRTQALAVRSWTEITMRAQDRGKGNPLYRDAIGEYNDVIIYDSEYMPETVASAAYGIFMGAQSGAIGFGNAYKKLHRKTMGKGSMFSWFEDDEDYGNETGIAGGAIFGIKKCRFESGTDYGCIRVQTTDVAAF